MSDRERVSDERLLRILNFAGDAADNVPGALGAYADAMSIDVTLSVFAEVRDARDRIARAAEAAECIRGATSCIWLGWPETDWCSACRARAILTQP